jgi:CheY-like chemotaxis protein
MLEKLGYDVLEAKGGREAIETYKKNEGQVDLVILDMIMPDIGGGDTYDKLRKINSKIKIMLSSGYSINGQATEIMERGCNSFIQKPFNMKELSQKIMEVLNN